MVWWQYIKVWTVAEGPNSKARKVARPPRGHHVTVALSCVLGGLGMSSGLGTPQVGARNKMTPEVSHEETELCSNMNYQPSV